MESFTKTPKRFSLRRAHVAVLAIVAACGLFDGFYDLNGPMGWLRRLCSGIWISQPVLLGVWAAIGPPPAVKRLPLTVAVLALLSIASSTHWHGPNSGARLLECTFLMFGLFLGSALCIRLAAIHPRWQIASAVTQQDTINQFSIKYMIGLTTIIAVTLAIIRILAVSANSSVAPLWTSNMLRLTRVTGIILLAMLPLLAIPMIVLSRRPAAGIIATMILIWIATTWAAIQIVITLDSVPWDVITSDLIGFQIGGMITGAIVALALRSSGYRLRTGKPVTNFL